MATARPERYYPWIGATAVLAPLIGGQISLEPQPLAPGGLLAAIWGEPAGSFLAHLIIFLPLAIGLFLALGKRAVLQVPHVRTTFAWLLFGAVLLASVGMSSYRFASLQTLAEWGACLIGLFATVALVGRSDGPKWVAGAFSLGCSGVALMAIREYAMQPDPTWRVIANWLNPNALAALMSMGILVSFGALRSFGAPSGEVTDQRPLGPLLLGLGGTFCSAALVLTGSKGGLLAFGGGALVFFVSVMVWGRSAKALVGPLVIVAVGCSMAYGLVAIHKKPATTGPEASAFGRVAGAGATSEQSAGFRKLLWSTSISLIKDNPMGRGLGTFRHYSAQPGLVTQTQLAHESYLQLGVEAGVAGLVLFLVALFFSLADVLRGARTLPVESAPLRSGLFAALASMAAHSLFDSDFSQFGLGLTFFILLGTLFQLSADATVPEFSPKQLRLLGGGIAAVVAIALAAFGWEEVQLSAMRYAIGARDLPAAQAAYDSASAVGGSDPRLWLLGSRIAQSPEEQKQRVERSIALGPTPATYRMLADQLEKANDLTGAERELNASLRLDPNNLFSLKRLMDLKLKVDAAAAAEVAKRLVAVESTSYFKIRSLPEMVPTETFEARSLLAASLSGEAKTAMLRPALSGYLDYARLTVPQVCTFRKAGMDGGYGGIRVEDAQGKMQDARKVAEALNDGEAVAIFDAAISQLSGQATK